MQKLSLRKVAEFQKTVWDFYYVSGRHDLPWRQSPDPYRVLVSELMLQQTQVDRVIPKYIAFIERWPTVEKLAAASLKDVLIAWQGLGYNRRAKYVHETAKAVVKDHKGKFPVDEASLRTLPGVGPYTASALMAFAYDEPTVLIETNVRQVFIHHFFAKQTSVTDADILELVQRTLPTHRIKQWYSALMDYGTYLKQTYGNNTQRSKHYSKQSRFKGSDREIRGAILRMLSNEPGMTTEQLVHRSGFAVDRIKTQVTALCAEGLLKKQGSNIGLA